ncbi:hypothetical protein Q4F19_04980 [Sphingomonas sp. BIUV-7]|uniref:Uncharacterized protein n=1 Tax=Sphingomonas natans TaxID=3063330 RepID=A0ABT8Y7L3_9SPHN|nr:hypothetical protein [Sphingomonas sp. BIUV-7]MDO6413729.1 hypothetical protein [Sphingomonas sp. BIUV-7]
MDDDASLLQQFGEDRVPWDGPVDRARMLVNRTVRNQQFRKRVLDA